MAANPFPRIVAAISRGLGLVAAALVLFTALTGCGIKKPATDPIMDKKAMAMAMAAREYNARITSSRGTGRLVTRLNGKKEKFKLAWAAQAPDRLRLTLLVSGHPVETIAASGRQVTFISHTGKHRPHSTLSADPDLDDYIGIPVRLSQLVSLLLGRVPVQKFDRAWIRPDRPDTIHAGKQFSPYLQELETANRGQINRYRVLDRNNDLVFGVEFQTFAIKNEFLVPTRLLVYDARDRTLEISLTGISPNAPVKESMFRLTGSGS